MKERDFNTSEQKDKIENVKQQQAEIQKILDYRIIPKKNHKLFEVNINTKKINLAEFLPPEKTIHWFEALNIFYQKNFQKVDIYNSKPITKSEVIKKDNCIYISALNEINVIKILERDFKIFKK